MRSIDNMKKYIEDWDVNVVATDVPAQPAANK